MNCFLNVLIIKTGRSLMCGIFWKKFSVSFGNYKSLSPIDLSYSLYKPDVKPASSVPLIISHGLLGSKLNWRSLGKAISRKTERLVYTLDARNHGDSPHTDDFSVSLMSADLKQFMDKEQMPEAILIGHSLGGRTSMHFTVENPDRVKKLVVVDVSPFVLPPSSALSPLYISLMKEAITTIGNSNLNKARNDIDKYLAQKVPDTPVRQFLLTNLAEKNGKIVWKPNIDALLKNYEKGILEMPALKTHYMGETIFICGEESPFVRCEDDPKIKSIFPKADIIRIKGAGHWVHSEKPAEFLQCLCEFLGS